MRSVVSPRARACATLAAVVALLVLPAVSSADLTAQETLILNTHATTSTGRSAPVTTSARLTAGRKYAIRVTGTYSAYAQRLMDGTPGWRVCGDPVRPPAGSGLTGLEGQDAEFVFAVPVPVRHSCPPLPFVHGNFAISLDNVTGPFTPAVPARGIPIVVNAQHLYVYHIIGAGHRASFAIEDSNTRDNYGKLTVVVIPR